MEKSVGTEAAPAVRLDLIPLSNYEPWVKYVVYTVVLPLTDFQTGVAIKLFVEKNHDVSELGRMSFDNYLKGQDFDKLGFMRKTNTRLQRRASGLVDRQNVIEPEVPGAAEGKSDAPQDDKATQPVGGGENVGNISFQALVRETYVIAEKDMSKLRDKNSEINEKTLMEQRRAFALIMSTIGKSSIDEASVNKEKWEEITITQNPFKLVEYMKTIHHKERGAVYEKKNREFQDVCQLTGERVASYIVRIDAAAEAVNLVASSDKKITSKDKAYRLVHGADKVRFDDLYKKYHHLKSEELESYTKLATEYSNNEEALDDIKQDTSAGKADVPKGLAATYSQVAGGGPAQPANGKERGKRCFTCEKYATNPDVGYDHLKGDKKCPSKAAWEKAKQAAAAQQGNKKGGNPSKPAGGKFLRCQVCVHLKEPAEKANTHVFSEVCPHFARMQPPAKAKLSINFDDIADDPEEEIVEAYMSQAVLDDPQVLKIATNLLQGPN
jgi:hypothetical protein